MTTSIFSYNTKSKEAIIFNIAANAILSFSVFGIRNIILRFQDGGHVLIRLHCIVFNTERLPCRLPYSSG